MDLKTISKSLTLSALSFFLATGVLYAASTIGANMVTTGTLSVTGASTLTGDVTSSGTITGADITSTDDVTAGDDLVVSGGTATITTTNSATSTAVVGCIQTTATSTGQYIKLVPFATSTDANGNAVGSNNGGNTPFGGYVMWAYGSC
ncbi:MAG: hypothetical protein A2571_01230 [Candidatus Vogelbacteria bacterium RIFOXYD1_FULL_44_32]|uniref:DUF5666 domain-containing protein n=1 Tax=Candidatus Vogelbacteria bacterium RIFOXYD1_FULL_44_32 TaxID=1802438 RepID=A0A1G2QG40_9BACT|nr:MAG: hypothetical protein A2571_01230 [Candidatus Vogelbacteria bacterium RIFOXYD1_FULL_44_32]